MPRTESRTKTSLWAEDEDFRALSVRAQWMYWFLFSQPNINLCGIVPLTIKKWARVAKDETHHSITEMLLELCSIELHPDRTNQPFIVVDWETEEVFVRSFIKNDRVCRSPFTRKAAYEQLRGIASPLLRGLAEVALYAESAPHLAIADAEGPSEPPEPSEKKEQVKTPCHTPQGDITPISPSPSVPKSPSLPPDAIRQARDLIYKPLKGAPDGAGDLATPQKRLVNRLEFLCSGNDRKFVRHEAEMLVSWASSALDVLVIEQVIGRCENWKRKPVVPHALAGPLQRCAAEAGVPLPPFVPPTSKRQFVS